MNGKYGVLSYSIHCLPTKHHKNHVYRYGCLWNVWSTSCDSGVPAFLFSSFKAKQCYSSFIWHTWMERSWESMIFCEQSVYFVLSGRRLTTLIWTVEKMRRPCRKLKTCLCTTQFQPNIWLEVRQRHYCSEHHFLSSIFSCLGCVKYISTVLNWFVRIWGTLMWLRQWQYSCCVNRFCRVNWWIIFNCGC